jgi:hypothetical protein
MKDTLSRAQAERLMATALQLVRLEGVDVEGAYRYDERGQRTPDGYLNDLRLKIERDLTQWLTVWERVYGRSPQDNWLP